VACATPVTYSAPVGYPSPQASGQR
jgi:hypothetical protein